MKYTETMIVFSEIPDYITLDINISNCPHRCPECHSPWLREDIGKELNEESLRYLINSHQGINCVLLSGGDASHDMILKLATFVKNTFPKLKIARYSGDDEKDEKIWNAKILDFYKIGSYKKEFGPLNSETTNQKLYELKNNEYVDITNKFLKKKII